jgi:hypothetical protein
MARVVSLRLPVTVPAVKVLDYRTVLALFELLE